jgi:DNA mismatch repair protein MutL
MSCIRILPEILANKIAAGEVVERPASVVKELVENALDAGSTRIAVEIENGGRALIRVADNGSGMEPDDALLAIERFATSKIRTDDDLFSIRTLGFRGEALPSIAAVSRLTLTTRTAAAAAGIEVRVEGGRILHVREAGAPVGTLIEAAQLFFNIPARRKFLKTISTEMGHVADIVAGMALGHPDVHLRLMHNGKLVNQWLRTEDAAARAAGVLCIPPGELPPVDARSGPLSLYGWLTPPHLARGTTRGIYLFVNGRRVRDRVIQHALLEGYGGRLIKGRFPAAALFLELPFDQVDVNVHPSKHEIRFAQSREVHRFVQAAVAAALVRAETPRLSVAPPAGPAAVAEVAEAGPAYLKALDVDWGASTAMPRRTGREPERAAAADSGSENPASARPPADQQPLWRPRRFADLLVIGQLRGTYIVCQEGADLVLIDQHAAHERIVYEALRQAAASAESQYLLVPETVELGYVEAAALTPLIPQLNELGLQIEPFGGPTFAVKAVPTVLDQRAAGRLVLELAEMAAQTGQGSDLCKRIDECRMIMACHHAVRANQHLEPQQIRHMLERLDKCENPSHCPHGRPTWIRWSAREIEKAFGRSAS